MPKKIFPLEEIKKLVEEDYSIAQLAKKYSTSRPTMANFLRENNLKTKKMLQDEKRATINPQEVHDLYVNERKTLKEIAKIYDVSVTPIKRILQDLKVPIRTNSESHQVYKVNGHYFDTIDTFNKAYLLGFLAADGFVTDRNEIGIGVAIKDEAIVKFFKQELESEHPLTYKENSCELRFGNEKICKKLNEYGIVPRKSLVLDLKDIIKKAGLDEEKTKACLLGYFDGDGGIYKYTPKEDSKYTTIQYSCSITGTLETCNYFKEYFDDIGFMTKRHKDEKNNYTYQIGGRNMVRKALSKLYTIKDNLDFYFERKYTLFEEL